MTNQGQNDASEVVSWKRLSKTEAAARATRLAIHFMQNQDTKGFDWTCVGATPDVSNPINRERKTPRYWLVCVAYRLHGALRDGPASLLVDLESGEVVFT